MFRIRRQVVPAQENGPNTGVPILHLVPEREAIHRLHEDFRDQEVHVLPLDHVQALLAGACMENFIARSLLQDVECSPDVLFPVNYENLHGLLIFIFPAASVAAGIF